MGKISNPTTLSSHFGIREEDIDKFGIVDVLLDTDTPLFIDPMLLEDSEHPEIRDGAAKSYVNRFGTIIRLLMASREEGDPAWKAAKRQFKFSEVSWTCLGYGSGTRGSGFGPDLVAVTLDTASKIINLGVEDTDLFMAMALFEEGIGPDRISDMTTNIIIEDLIQYNYRVIKALSLPTAPVKVGNTVHDLLHNPLTGEPLVMVPQDIVRELPVAKDWSDIARVVRENEDLRDRVNGTIGEIFARMSAKEKKQIKKRALASRKAMEEVIAMLRSVDARPYDFDKDRCGELFWAKFSGLIAEKFPFDLTAFRGRKLDIADVKQVVDTILEQFQDLVENKGLWKELWTEEDKPRKEKAAQRLFYAVAYSYCKANDLDLTPEADSGNGPVDFKVSQGHQAKVVVEFKLSTGTVKHGYERQLEIYKKADDTDVGIFVIMDVGSIGRKYAEIQVLRDQQIEQGLMASDIVMIDANQKASASKR